MRELPRYYRLLFNSLAILVYLPMALAYPALALFACLALMNSRFDWSSLVVGAIPLFGLVGLYCGFRYYRSLVNPEANPSRETLIGLLASTVLASLSGFFIYAGTVIVLKSFHVPRALSLFLAFWPFLALLLGLKWAALYHRGWRAYPIESASLQHPADLTKAERWMILGTWATALICATFYGIYFARMGH